MRFGNTLSWGWKIIGFLKAKFYNKTFVRTVHIIKQAEYVWYMVCLYLSQSFQPFNSKGQIAFSSGGCVED